MKCLIYSDSFFYICISRCSPLLSTPEAFFKAPDCGKHHLMSLLSLSAVTSLLLTLLSPPPLPFSQSIKLQIPSVPSCSPCLSSAPQSPSSETSSGYSWKVFHLPLHQMMRQGRGIKILQHSNTERFSSETFRNFNFPTMLQVAFKATVCSLNTTVCCCRDPIE